MSTIRQKKLANEIVLNMTRQKPKNKTQLLENVGYKKNTAKAMAERTITQKGVIEELEILGFSADNAKKVVQEIMNDDDVDPSARLKATDQVFKVTGAYAPEKIAHTGEFRFGALENLSNEELAKLAESSES